MTSLLVEGWRWINHSYAMVNQYQLLELKERGLQLFHIDRPYVMDNWTPEKSNSGFDAARTSTIAGIAAPSDPDFAPDITYRIDFPYRLTPARSKRLFVFATSESQNLDYNFDPAQVEAGLANPDLTIVTPSHWSKAGFLKAGFADERIAVVPHGVDGRIFKPLAPERRAAVRTRLGLKDGEYAILSLGAMTKNKGIDLLIAAYAILRLRYPHLRLMLKDSSSLYGISGLSIFESLAQFRPDLMTDALRQSIVFFSSDLNLEALCDLYGAADCYASPYRAEGFNLPPLEAAACGLPIVVTKGGPTDDYQHPSFALQIDGHRLSAGAGVVIEPDLNSLMDKLALLIDGKATAIDRDAAIKHVNAHHSWTAAVDKLVDLFKAA
jgi:glycosyltransferase involved in cell wall biosynthesis